jgi:hypothetical protein
MIEPGTANLQVKTQNSIFESHRVPPQIRGHCVTR